MIYESKSNEMVGKVESDLIVDNNINRIEWQEDKIDIEYSHTNDLSANEVTAGTDGIFYATNSIDPANPFKDYKGEIVNTQYGNVALFDIITPKNRKYYKVVWDSSPYAILHNIGDEQKIGGSLYDISSYDEFKRNLTTYITQYFTHEASLVESSEYTINEKLSVVHLVMAVKLGKSKFQILIGCSADLYSVKRESSIMHNGTGSNVYSLASNELFTDGTMSGESKAVEINATEILNGYERGRQTMRFSVVANHAKWYRVRDIVIPYGFNGNPIARYSDGTPKRFIVTGCEFVYKGGYRQNLELIEEV